MASVLTPKIMLLLFAATAVCAMESGKPEKIIIHVPYKIQHHHHTHTRVINMDGKNAKIDKVEKLKEKEDVETEAKDMLLGSYKFADAATTAQFAAPKVRTFLNVHEKTNFPLLNYLGLDHLLGLDNKQPPKQIHVIHNEPLVQHVLQPATALPLTDAFKAEDFQFGDSTSLLNSYDTKTPFLNLRTPKTASAAFFQNDFTYPAKVTSSDVNSAFQKIIQKHLYTDFPELKYGKHYLVPKSNAGLSGSLYRHHFDVDQAAQFNEKLLHTTTPEPILTEKDGSQYEHIGYLVVGDGSQKFVGVDEKVKNSFDS